MIETQIYSALCADTTVAAVVGSRIYPLVMPQVPTLPAITYHRVSSSPVNTLSGRSNLTDVHVAVNCWGTAYDTVKELAEDVADGMNTATAFHALLLTEFDGYDPETGLFVASQDYSCWEK